MTPVRNLIKNSSIAAFGCSHTYGVGVAAEEAWPYILKAMNFGRGSSSIDAIARFIPEKLEENPEVDTVLLLAPDWSRFEYVKDGEYF